MRYCRTTIRRRWVCIRMRRRLLNVREMECIGSLMRSGESWILSELEREGLLRRMRKRRRSWRWNSIWI